MERLGIYVPGKHGLTQGTQCKRNGVTRRMRVYSRGALLLVGFGLLLLALTYCATQARAYNYGFVKASGTHLTLNGYNYRYDGTNMYYLNSRSNSGPTYTSSHAATSLYY